MEKLIDFIGAPYAPNTIVFSLNAGEEVIKLSKEGFYYKGKLIIDDKEIYLRFKEWIDQAYSQIPKPEPQKFNSIEERDNLIGLFQEALKFYANPENYKGNKNTSACYSGVSASLVEMDEGSQARFAIEKAKQLAEQNQKIQEDYDKLMAGYEQLQASESIADTEELIKVFKIMGDDKNKLL
jgi:hypothetical protein